MPRLSLLPTLLREIFGERTLQRELEPDLIMNEEDQVAAYAIAGRIDGVMAAAYLFHAAQASKVLSGCRNAIDLGCGPATQLIQIAKLHPDVHFTGIDLSEAMLETARRQVAEHRLANVSLVCDDIARLGSIADRATDAVISTMALHHLPSSADLCACFQQINRILKTGGALYISDFVRLKSERSVRYFKHANQDHQPPIFTLDYERSLRAAFLLDELKQLALAELPPTAKVCTTFLVPFLAVVKTPDQGLTSKERRTFQAMRAALPKRYRRDLDDLRRFFRLGGLEGDPFS